MFNGLNTLLSRGEGVHGEQGIDESCEYMSKALYITCWGCVWRGSQGCTGVGDVASKENVLKSCRSL